MSIRPFATCEMDTMALDTLREGPDVHLARHEKH